MLHLYGNRVGDVGVTALASACATGALASVSTLNLFGNQIGDDGMKSFSSALSMGAMALTVLHLGGNNITDDGLATLMPLMQKDGKLSNLTAFSIGKGITDKGMIEFSNLLATGAMAQLKVSWRPSPML